MHSLESLGWTSFFQQQLDRERESGLRPARVVEEQRGSFRIRDERGERYAELAGRLRHEIGRGEAPNPCVGDWVLALGDAAPGPAVIRRVLERRSCFSRKEAGTRTVEQVVAANVDTVFLVQSLNRDLNPRRLERYLALLWESGAVPVLVLSKADLCDRIDEVVASLEPFTRGIEVLAVSALTEGGLAPLHPYLLPGSTAALVGSSGVGKSTLVNRLLGEERFEVKEIREDGRGRHTTTSRHLVVLPSGGLLIDTPGMRTVLLWEGEEGLARAFEDVEALRARCRFRDCTHTSEPGCAIREALETGELDAARYRSYDKLQREARHEAAKTDIRLRLERARKWRRIHMEARQRPDKRRFR